MRMDLQVGEPAAQPNAQGAAETIAEEPEETEEVEEASPALAAVSNTIV
jgi:hypothetical protein